MSETTTSSSDRGRRPGKKTVGKKATGQKGQGKGGRPSLDKGGKSPQISFRVAGPIRKKAKEVAEKENMNVSQLSRKALKEYLSKQ